MKKLGFIANIFFLFSLIIMILVILQQIGIIHFLPTTIDPYKPTTLEERDMADQYTLLINSIGYIFLLISITMHIVNLKLNKTKNKICTIENTNTPLRLIKLLFYIFIIIFTLVTVVISLLITLLSLIEIPYIP